MLLDNNITNFIFTCPICGINMPCTLEEWEQRCTCVEEGNFHALTCGEHSYLSMRNKLKIVKLLSANIQINYSPN